jgi:hypothetical protein
MSFRTYQQTRRVPARAIEPLVDLAGRSPESLRDVASWSSRITDQDRAGLIGATAVVNLGFDPRTSSQREFARYVSNEMAKWEQIVKTMGSTALQ